MRGPNYSRSSGEALLAGSVDSHKRNTQSERLEVMDTGRRGRWSNDVADRDGERGATRDILEGETLRHLTFVADDLARAFGPKPLALRASSTALVLRARFCAFELVLIFVRIVTEVLW